MTNTKEIILKLKEVREEKGLSYGDILDLMEKNNDFVSKSTISRVFSEGSENLSFRYEETLRPIAKALLDIETIEADDNVDVRAMKSLLQYKIQRIEELEAQIEQMEAAFAKERLKYVEEMEQEKEQSRKSFDFLKKQIEQKDHRIDFLLEANMSKDLRYDELLNLIMSCPCRKAQEGKEN